MTSCDLGTSADTCIVWLLLLYCKLVMYHSPQKAINSWHAFFNNVLFLNRSQRARHLADYRRTTGVLNKLLDVFIHSLIVHQPHHS